MSGMGSGSDSDSAWMSGMGSGSDSDSAWMSGMGSDSDFSSSPDMGSDSDSSNGHPNVLPAKIVKWATDDKSLKAKEDKSEAAFKRKMAEVTRKGAAESKKLVELFRTNDDSGSSPHKGSDSNPSNPNGLPVKIVKWATDDKSLKAKEDKSEAAFKRKMAEVTRKGAAESKKLVELFR